MGASWAGAGLLAAVGATWAAGWQQASRPVVEHWVFQQVDRDLKLMGQRRLLWQAEVPPAVGRPLRLVHLSDLHLHRRTGLAHRRGLWALERARPHLVVITGDFADGGTRRAALEGYMRSVAAVAPTVAVLGNHDLEEPARSAMVVEALKAAGVHLLRNRRAWVRGSFGQVEVVGLDSPDLGLDDLEQALARPAVSLWVDHPAGAAGGAAGALRVTLAHSYHVLLHKPLARWGALVLVGDTHGGQVVLPGLGPFWARWVHRHRYVSGLYRVDRTWLYVSRGLGTIGPPVRWRCPPEVAVFDLWMGDGPVPGRAA